VSQLVGGDLAPRDQVSRALARCMRDQAVENLWLDLRPVGKDRLERQFPTILGRCRSLGLHPFDAPLPVAPAAHYWMGGVSTDLEAAASLEGLYAVGEVACTGVHGANRLASNSLMECLVFARQLRRIRLLPLPASGQQERVGHLDPEGLNPQQLQAEIRALRQLCWDVAGVERRGPDLLQALPAVRARRRQTENSAALRRLQGLPPGEQLEIPWRSRSSLLMLQDLWHRQMLAELLIEAASFRTESRGGHFRTDTPAAQPFWRRHTVQRRDTPIRTTGRRGLRGLRLP
jgi:L-aspartate oxidase